MTLKRFSVLATHQKRVHQDLAVGEPETEDLIRHGKEVLHFLILQIHCFTSRNHSNFYFAFNRNAFAPHHFMKQLQRVRKHYG